MTGYRGCMYCIVHEKKSCFKRVTHIVKPVITSEKKKRAFLNSYSQSSKTSLSSPSLLSQMLKFLLFHPHIIHLPQFHNLLAKSHPPPRSTTKCRQFISSAVVRSKIARSVGGLKTVNPCPKSADSFEPFGQSISRSNAVVR